MIDNGKDKLEWYRTVDAAKLDHLKEMMLQVSLMMLCMVLMLKMISQDNYKENLGTLIRTIYDFAFVTYVPHICCISHFLSNALAIGNFNTPGTLTYLEVRSRTTR